MAVKQLSDGGSDGVKLGQSATDKVGFYGATAVVQPSCTLAAALTAGTTTPANIAAALFEVRAALVLQGLIS
jgi:hypothetical protein